MNYKIWDGRTMITCGHKIKCRTISEHDEKCEAGEFADYRIPVVFGDDEIVVRQTYLSPRARKLLGYDRAPPSDAVDMPEAVGYRTYLRQPPALVEEVPPTVVKQTKPRPSFFQAILLLGFIIFLGRVIIGI